MGRTEGLWVATCSLCHSRRPAPICRLLRCRRAGSTYRRPWQRLSGVVSQFTLGTVTSGWTCPRAHCLTSPFVRNSSWELDRCWAQKSETELAKLTVMLERLTASEREPGVQQQAEHAETRRWDRSPHSFSWGCLQQRAGTHQPMGCSSVASHLFRVSLGWGPPVFAWPRSAGTSYCVIFGRPSWTDLSLLAESFVVEPM